MGCRTVALSPLASSLLDITNQPSHIYVDPASYQPCPQTVGHFPGWPYLGSIRRLGFIGRLFYNGAIFLLTLGFIFLLTLDLEGNKTVAKILFTSGHGKEDF